MVAGPGCPTAAGARHGVGEEAVELRRRDPRAAAVGEPDGLDQQPLDVPARSSRWPSARAGAAAASGARARARGRGRRPSARSHLLSTSAVAQPLLHRELGDPEILGGDPVGRVADDERHVGALGGTPGAQRRVVLDRLRRPSPGAAGRRCRSGSARGPRRSSAGRSRRGWCPRPRRRSRVGARGSG